MIFSYLLIYLTRDWILQMRGKFCQCFAGRGGCCFQPRHADELSGVRHCAARLFRAEPAFCAGSGLEGFTSSDHRFVERKIKVLC